MVAKRRDASVIDGLAVPCRSETTTNSLLLEYAPAICLPAKSHNARHRRYCCCGSKVVLATHQCKHVHTHKAVKGVLLLLTSERMKPKLHSSSMVTAALDGKKDIPRRASIFASSCFFKERWKRR